MKLNDILNESFKLFKDESIKKNPFLKNDEFNATINAFKTAVSKGFLKDQEKDINYWRKNGGFNKLHDRLLNASNNMSKREGKALARKADVIQLTETPNYTVIIPLTPEASRMHGAGTKWCVSSRNVDYFNDYFATYNTLGRLVIIFLPKHGHLPKLAAAITSDSDFQLYDDRDGSINSVDFNGMIDGDILKIISMARSRMPEKDAAVIKQAKTNKYIASKLLEKGQIDPEVVKDILLTNILYAIVYVEFGGKDYDAIKERIPLKADWNLGRLLRHMPKGTWPEAERLFSDFRQKA